MSLPTVSWLKTPIALGLGSYWIFQILERQTFSIEEIGRLKQTPNVIVLTPSFSRLLISCKIKANWMIWFVVNKQFKICHLCFLIMNNVLQPLETKQQCISQSSTLSERGIRSRHQNSHSVLSGNRIHLCKVITIHGKSFIFKSCVVNS